MINNISNVMQCYNVYQSNYESLNIKALKKHLEGSRDNQEISMDN